MARWPPPQVSEAVESWLSQLAGAMRATLQRQTDALVAGRLPDEFKAAASQTLMLKEAVTWTERWGGERG